MRKIKKAYKRDRIQTSISDRTTKAVQSEKHNCCINHIVSKAFQTGQLPTLMNRKHIEQLPDVLDYQDAMNKIVYAQQQFLQLPSTTRNEFDNDPVKFLECLSDPEKNLEKLQKAAVLEPVKQKIDPILQELQKLNSSLGKQSDEVAIGGKATE